ncbi:uncharacterized protein TNCV_4930801 [Trichonephila clavipes]|nr:uncharacterized protein TNCV_4930801 [Trichonephila clavipes]
MSSGRSLPQINRGVQGGIQEILTIFICMCLETFLGREIEKKGGEMLEALLDREENKCYGKKCSHSEECCKGAACVEIEGLSGTCLPIHGKEFYQPCEKDSDCGAGLVCIDSGDFAPSKTCQLEGRSIEKKGFSLYSPTHLKRTQNDEKMDDFECRRVRVIFGGAQVIGIWQRGSHLKLCPVLHVKSKQFNGLTALCKERSTRNIFFAKPRGARMLADKLEAFDNIRRSLPSGPRRYVKASEIVNDGRQVSFRKPERPPKREYSHQVPNERSPLRCYGCGKQGVIKSRCPTCSFNASQRTDVATNHINAYTAQTRSPRLTLIDITFCVIKGRVCADTGSSHSIAGERMFQIFKNKGLLFQETTSAMSLADGQ